MFICTDKDVLHIPRELANKHQLMFIDHYKDPNFVGHAELFYDFGHLNRKGAEYYSHMIAQELKNTIGLPAQ